MAGSAMECHPGLLHAMQAARPVICRKFLRIPAVKTIHILRGFQDFARFPGLLLQDLLQHDCLFVAGAQRPAGGVSVGSRPDEPIGWVGIACLARRPMW